MSDETRAAPAGAGDLQQIAITLLGGKATDRVRKALTTYVILGTAVRLGRAWIERGRAELTYSITVHGSDPIYPTLHRWLLDRMPPKRRRALVARTRTEAHYDGDQHRTRGKLGYFFDGSRPQVVLIEGHRVRVSMVREEGYARRSSHEQPEASSRFMDLEHIEFSVFGESGRDAVARFLTAIVEDHYSEDRQPELNIANRWGGWERRPLGERSLDRVYLREGQKEGIREDLAKFLASEKDYAMLGLPWHRGYLLEGPPGTGKTSLAKALANEFGLDIYYVPLADLNHDADLLQIVASVKPGSILLLEDIDIFHAATSREEEASKVTLSALLNALDGVVTPHGLITIMTSNNAAVLDDALRREGRVDRTETIGYLTNRQLHDLVGDFLGHRVALVGLPQKLAPARVVGALKENMGDEEASIQAIKAMLG